MYSSVARLNKMSFDSACKISILSGRGLKNDGTSYLGDEVEKALSGRVFFKNDLLPWTIIYCIINNIKL